MAGSGIPAWFSDASALEFSTFLLGTHQVLGEGSYPFKLAGCPGVLKSIAEFALGRRPLVLACNFQGGVEVWDTKDAKILRTLTGHKDNVAHLDVDFAEHRVLTGSLDGSLKLWDLRSGECLDTLIGHRRGVAKVQADFVRQRAVSVGLVDGVKIWDLQLGRCIRDVPPPVLEGNNLRMAVAVAADFSAGKLLHSFGKGLRLTDMESGEAIATIPKSAGQSTSLALDMKSMQALEGTATGDVSLWSLTDARRTLSMRHETGRTVSSVQANFAKLRVLSASDDDLEIRIWDLRDGTCLQSLSFNNFYIPDLHPGMDVTCAMAADLDTLTVVSASYCHNLRVFRHDARSDKCKKMTGEPQDPVLHLAADFHAIQDIFNERA